MALLAQVFIILVALLHVWFLVLEMFLWTKPLGRKAFGQSREKAEASKVLAANMGLYNGFLAAGLIWAMLPGEQGFQLKLFFLACVIIAGVFGAVTANIKILYIQALPAVLALLFLLMSL